MYGSALAGPQPPPSDIRALEVAASAALTCTLTSGLLVRSSAPPSVSLAFSSWTHEAPAPARGSGYRALDQPTVALCGGGPPHTTIDTTTGCVAADCGRTPAVAACAALAWRSTSGMPTESGSAGLAVELHGRSACEGVSDASAVAALPASTSTAESNSAEPQNDPAPPANAASGPAVSVMGELPTVMPRRTDTARRLSASLVVEAFAAGEGDGTASMRPWCGGVDVGDARGDGIGAALPSGPKLSSSVMIALAASSGNAVGDTASMGNAEDEEDAGCDARLKSVPTVALALARVAAVMPTPPPFDGTISAASADAARMRLPSSIMTPDGSGGEAARAALARHATACSTATARF